MAKQVFLAMITFLGAILGLITSLATSCKHFSKWVCTKLSFQHQNSLNSRRIDREHLVSGNRDVGLKITAKWSDAPMRKDNTNQTQDRVRHRTPKSKGGDNIEIVSQESTRISREHLAKWRYEQNQLDELKDRIMMHTSPKDMRAKSPETLEDFSTTDDNAEKEAKSNHIQLTFSEEDTSATQNEEEPLIVQKDSNTLKKPSKGKKRINLGFMPATVVKLDTYDAINRQFLEEHIDGVYTGERSNGTMQMLLNSQVVAKEYSRIFPKQFVRRRLGCQTPSSTRNFTPTPLTTIFEKVAYR